MDQETYEKVTEKCKEEFLKHHPEMRKFKISQNVIVDAIADYYLEN